MSTLDSYTDEQLDARKGRAPEYIQQLLDSKEFGKTLYTVGGDAGLQVDEIGFLFEEVVAMLLGITSPEKFRKMLDAEFDISNEAVDEIVTKLNETVFMPLRDAISHKENTLVEEKPEPKQFENTLAENPVLTEALEEVKHADTTQEVSAPEEKAENTYSVDPYREPLE